MSAVESGLVGQREQRVAPAFRHCPIGGDHLYEYQQRPFTRQVYQNDVG